jgi:hypothetical protein
MGDAPMWCLRPTILPNRPDDAGEQVNAEGSLSVFWRVNANGMF